MQSFGIQNVIAGQTNLFTTGVGWEYLQIWNESLFQLDLNFSGCGSIGMGGNYRSDIKVPRGYTGQLLITPSSLLNLQNPPSAFVSVNAFAPGELTSPQSAPLARISNQGNFPGQLQHYFITEFSTTDASGAPVTVVTITPASTLTVYIGGIDASLSGNSAGLQTWTFALTGISTISGNQPSWSQDLNQFVSPVLLRFPSPLYGTLGNAVSLTSQKSIAGMARYAVYFFTQ